MGKYFLIGCFVVISVISVEAQNVPRTASNRALKHYNNAKQHYSFYAFSDAVSELREAVKVDPGFIDAHLLLAEISFDMKDYLQAIESYKNVVRIDVDFFPMSMFNLAHLERLSGFYDDAREHFKQFLGMETENERRRAEAMEGIRNCEFSIEAVKNPVPFNPLNLGSAINSDHDEYWPSITADGLTLVVTVQIPKKTRSTGMGVNVQEDFFISTWENGRWLPKKNMGKPINTELNEGAQSLSADGHFMFFTACNRPDGLGSCDIYFSTWLGHEWSPPRNIGKPINTSLWDAHPSISPDGKTLYFCSRRPGGRGKIDLWKSMLTDDGYWGEPENLGDKLNTPGDEMSPFIHPDNKTLYFSSNGLPGLGDFDLYVTRMDVNGEW
ncbi:MAG: PD40 domain-containing protein, partial [Bacteroidales bacterium]